MNAMRWVATGWLVASLAGVADAQSRDELGRILDRQQRDLQRQQSETEREIEAQGRALQQQQEETLQRQLDRLPREPRPFERPLTCPLGRPVCD